MMSGLRSGFTLVELSIVLVIIGLLIGGILVAQSMIQTVKIQSFVKQIQSFSIAIDNFETKFNSLPGDSKVMGCINGGGNSCGNGIIEDSMPVAWTYNFDAEAANFWPNLQVSGLLNKGTLSPIITGSFLVKGTIINSPLGVIGKNTGFVPFQFYDNVSFIPTGLYLQAADYSTSVTTTDPYASPVGSIPARDAMAIDTKIDNGTADKMANFDQPSADTNVFADDNFGGNCIAGGLSGTNYNISTNGNCVLYIRVRHNQ